jgi:hypothetical protein
METISETPLSLSKKSDNLTQLIAWEDFIELCHPENS